eukprot:5898847-Amphidinium_carterae.1
MERLEKVATLWFALQIVTSIVLQGECIRTVPVVALKIMRKLDNKMLVLVAKFKGVAQALLETSD